MSSNQERILRKANMMNAVGVIHATDDSDGIHRVQIHLTPREMLDGVPVMQLYGFASHAKPSAHAHVLFVTGDRSRGIAVATNDPSARPRDTKQGEVVIYTDEGDTIALHRNHHIDITTTGTVTIDAPLVVVTGDLHVQGAVIAGYGGSDQVGLQTHRHTQGSDSRGDGEQPTDPPEAGT